VLVSIVCGALMGLISERFGGLITAKA